MRLDTFVGCKCIGIVFEMRSVRQKNRNRFPANLRVYKRGVNPWTGISVSMSLVCIVYCHSPSLHKPVNPKSSPPLIPTSLTMLTSPTRHQPHTPLHHKDTPPCILVPPYTPRSNTVSRTQWESRQIKIRFVNQKKWLTVKFANKVPTINAYNVGTVIIYIGVRCS